MISSRDFSQYYQNTFLRNKVTQSISEVTDVQLMEDHDKGPFNVVFCAFRKDGGRDNFQIIYDGDESFWSLFETVNPPLGYIQHSSGVAVLLSMQPARQYLKSLSYLRIRATIPNPEACSLCKITVRREEMEIISGLFAPYDLTYTQAYFELFNGDKLGVALSKRLAMCANTSNTIPDLFYKLEKIGTCFPESISLFPRMKEYKEHVQEITKVGNIKCV